MGAIHFQCTTCGKGRPAAGQPCPICGTVFYVPCTHCGYPRALPQVACPSCGMQIPDPYSYKIELYAKGLKWTGLITLVLFSALILLVRAVIVAWVVLGIGVALMILTLMATANVIRERDSS